MQPPFILFKLGYPEYINSDEVPSESLRLGVMKGSFGAIRG